jgi:para-nitrobenzyl esterase
VVDGYFYPKTIPEIFKAKEQAHVPLLLGWNSAEVSGAAFMQGEPYTDAGYKKRLKAVYPEDVEKVLKLYPPGPGRGTEASATALASDRFIAYSTWKWFDLHRKNSKQPVYRYLYSKVRPPLVDQSKVAGLAGGTVDKNSDAQPVPTPLGAPHACEIEYCMGNLHLIKEYAWTPDDYKVSETMLQYFANFILKGDPNGDHLPAWPAADPNDTTPPVMVIDVESKAMDAPDDARYLFLDKAYKN